MEMNTKPGPTDRNSESIATDSIFISFHFSGDPDKTLVNFVPNDTHTRPSCKVLILEKWDKSPDAEIDMHLALPQACWDWRNWSDAFSSPGRRCRSGCWMTTWTLRRCWRRSAMTKWPPSSLMPMLLSLISSSRRSTFKHWYILRAAHMCTVKLFL